MLRPLPSGAAENVFDASFTPVGRVTVWTMSRPFVDLGKPENWNTKLVPRLPRVGTALIVIDGCGGGGGGLVGAGGTGAAVVAERAAVALADARGAELGEVVAVCGVTSHAAQMPLARTRAAISFGIRPR